MLTNGRWKVTLEDVTAVMLGHAIGDALGMPVEFMSREELSGRPVTGYLGYGSHPVPPGTWSDDTSMALAALDSLAHGLDYADMMERFCAWKTKAAYTATGEVFDMGITTNDALCRFQCGVSPLACGSVGENDNGNGALMRIIPGVLYCLCRNPGGTMEEQMGIIHDLSALTHAHVRSQIGCGIYAVVLARLLETRDKSAIHQGVAEARAFYEKDPRYAGELSHYARLFAPAFGETPEEEIQSTGYVVSTLEAAIWCVLSSDSYRDCVLKAVNLGKDTDTVAAVAGGLAGALYGRKGIPEEWLGGLLRKDMILALCEAFLSPDSAKDSERGGQEK